MFFSDLPSGETMAGLQNDRDITSLQRMGSVRSEPRVAERYIDVPRPISEGNLLVAPAPQQT